MEFIPWLFSKSFAPFFLNSRPIRCSLFVRSKQPLQRFLLIQREVIPLQRTRGLGQRLFRPLFTILRGRVCLYLLPIYLSLALTKQIRPRAPVLLHPVCPCAVASAKSGVIAAAVCSEFCFCLCTSVPRKQASAGFEIIQHNRHHFLCVFTFH
jgi:hypothetical protein